MADSKDPLSERNRLEALAAQICARAAQEAQATCRLLELIGQFDADGGLGFLRNVKSVAHWLSWSCSMSSGVAREHVRVARALRQMPTLTAAFRSGELSYSKVREATRVVGQVDEAELCELARSETASQLARTVSGFRTASGTRIRQQESRHFAVVPRSADEMAGFIGKVPTEEAGIVTAALRVARDRNAGIPPAIGDGTAPSGSHQAGQSRGSGAEQPELPTESCSPDAGRATPPYTDADALLDICRHYLNTATADDDSGEDRHLVVVEVAAEQLAAQPVIESVASHAPPREPNISHQVGADGENVPAETGCGNDPAQTVAESNGRDDTDLSGAVLQNKNVPAEMPMMNSPACPPSGTSQIRDRSQTGWTPDRSGSGAGPDANAMHVPTGTPGGLRSRVCCVRGAGGIEPATATRLVCTGTLLGAVVDAHGAVLALGRSRRLVSKTQRRALMIRDQMCQFPGCAQVRHLDAHHITPWSRGGRTDLDQLVLLCRFHHTCVHEGGIQIVRDSSRAGQARQFSGARAGGTAWKFSMPDGEVLSAGGPRVRNSRQLTRRLTDLQAPGVEHIHGLGHPESRTIRPNQTGERFDLHEAVEALFRMKSAPTAEAA